MSEAGEMVRKGGLESASRIGARYGVTKWTVLKWYHEGVIPAELVVGRVYRFDPQAVALALKAHTRAEQAKKLERLPAGGVLVV